MKWFHDLKIATKLLGSFILVALIAGLIGFLGIQSTRKLDDSSTTLYEHMTVPIHDLSEVSTSMQRIQVNLRDIVLATSPEETKKYVAIIGTLRDTIDKSSTEFEKMILSEEVRKDFQEFNSSKKEFYGLVDRVSQLALIEKNTEAVAAMRQGLPIAKALEGSIDKLMEVKVKQAKAASESNSALASSAIQSSWIFVGVAVLFAVLLGWFISGAISKAIGQLNQAAEKLALGDVNALIEVNTKDELGMLAKSFRLMMDNIKERAEAGDRIAAGDLTVEVKAKSDQDTLGKAFISMVGTLRGLVAEVGTLGKAGVEGKLATRGEAAKFKGGYREIIQGVNDTLDAVIGPLNVSAEYVDRISKGDIPPRITDKYNGDFNEIKNNLNNCIDNINAMAADTGVLVKASTEGKLAMRADATKHQGDFRKIVEGINNTLDAVIGPLNVSAEYVDRISKGDIPPKITDKYNGDFNEIKNNLNNCIDNINAMVADTGVLIKASAEGQLATRADATKHQGDFRKIVGGVNEMLDAILLPIGEGNRILAQISSGKIDELIAQTYRGDHEKMKQAVNHIAVVMQGLQKELGRLTGASREGQLSERGKPDQFQGAYAEIVKGVNDMLDAILLPIGEGNRILAQISNGRIDELIAQTYKGDHEKMKQAVNNVAIALQDMAKDVTMLVKSAVDGNLAMRADTTKHQGDYRKIVEGVNQTLDAVIGPVNEAAATLDKVAAKDLTARVQGDYKGDLAKLKNVLNSAVQNLDEALVQVAYGAEQVASASGQISAGSQSLSQGASEQASSLEEVSSSLQEMSSMTKQNTANAKEARGLSDGARKSAEKGVENMKRLSEAIDKIKASSDATAKIVKTIDEIAFQTNLLALNAAVEAARAGDAGKGFAVVAEEVRNLAMRSAEAAKNTANLIEESVRNSEGGVAINQQVLNDLKEINGQVNKVSEVMGEIAAASEQQSQGVDQVNTAVEQMNQVTQQTAANAEESASAAEELNGQAEEMKGMVATFQLSGASGAVPGGPVAAHKPAVTQAKVAVSQRKAEVKAARPNGSALRKSLDPSKMIPFDEDGDAVLKEF